MEYKKYISVIVEYTPEGKVIPRSIQWENGQVFPVDRVLDVRPQASLKAGGVGMRYTVTIYGQIKYLFFDMCKWYVPLKHIPD